LTVCYKKKKWEWVEKVKECLDKWKWLLPNIYYRMGLFVFKTENSYSVHWLVQELLFLVAHLHNILLFTGVQSLILGIQSRPHFKHVETTSKHLVIRSTPWCSVLKMSNDAKPKWRSLYRPPLSKRLGDNGEFSMVPLQ